MSSCISALGAQSTNPVQNWYAPLVEMTEVWSYGAPQELAIEDTIQEGRVSNAYKLSGHVHLYDFLPV